MNQRERLIELLCSVECAGEEGFGNCPQRRQSRCSRLEGLEMCQIGAIADRLLANGVLVPPAGLETTSSGLATARRKNCSTTIPEYVCTSRRTVCG